MFRKLGMLTAFTFLFVLVGGAVPAPTMADTSPAVAVDSDVRMDEGKKDEGKKEKPKRKKMKLPPYAQYLKNKARKAPKPPPPKPKYKEWKKVLKDAEAHDGLIKVWTNREDVYFELSEDQMDIPFLAISSLSQGIGSHFVFGGLPVDNAMFDFHRSEDHLQIRRLSTRFRAPGDEKLRNAIDLTFSESILAALPIVSENDKGKSILVKVNKFFLSDVSGLSMWLGGVLRQPVRLDAKSAYFNEIKIYPENLEIDTRLTYKPGRPQALNLPNVPDSRFIQVGVQYSIRKLPETPMPPRLEDDRVGYFTTVHKDFEKTAEESFMVQYANRWRLEKKDPDAALSEPVNPIVFYLDRTIPDEYIQYLKEGVEWWQAAFEEAGFKNAIIAKPAPTVEEDPEYDPEDARYNTIRWNVSDASMYGAIGPSRVDPRTGEILDADILFEHNMVAGFGKIYRRVAGPREALMAIDPILKEFWMTDEEKANDISIEDVPQLGDNAHMMCMLNDCMGEGGNFLRVAMLGRGLLPAGSEMPMDFVGDALRFVAVHEVGHTLGLRHNFMSSGSTPYDKLNDKATIEQIGMTGSVMDYPTPNIAVNSDDQGYFYTPGVGTYDRWAIKWGYSEVSGSSPEEQAKNLVPIAAEAWKKEHLYATDEDTYPAHALDPRSNTNDLSDNPLQWAMDRIAICDDLLQNGKLEDRVIEDGGSYVPLRFAVQTLYIQKFIANLVAVKYIGGQYTTRAHKGDPGGQLPLATVPAADQQKALDFIINNALATKAWTLPPEMLGKLMDDKQRSWQNNPFQRGRRFDFPQTLWTAMLQNAVLTRLMNPTLQARVVEAQYGNDRPFKLSQVYSALTRSIWTNNPTPRGNNAGMDRNLQRLYLDRLIQQLLMPYPGTPQDAIALSRLNLRRIRGSAQTALQRTGLDDETNAHLLESIARIDRALDANRVTVF